MSIFGSSLLHWKEPHSIYHPPKHPNVYNSSKTELLGSAKPPINARLGLRASIEASPSAAYFGIDRDQSTTLFVKRVVSSACASAKFFDSAGSAAMSYNSERPPS